MNLFNWFRKTEPKTYDICVQWHRNAPGPYCVGIIRGLDDMPILALEPYMLETELYRILERWREIQRQPRAKFSISFDPELA